MTRASIRRTAHRGLTSAVALALVAVPNLAAHAQVVGVNSAVRNQVAIRARGTAPPRPAVVRQKVALRDAVETATASQLQMMLLDGSVFTVGPNARLTVDRFVYDPSRNVKSVGASVARGAFRFMSGRAGPGGNSSIRTPIATIGIRGTIVEGVVGVAAMRIAAGEAAVGSGVVGDPNSASLIVLRGPGPKTQGAVRPGAIDVTSGGRTVSAMQPAMAIYVPRAGAAPIGPFPISSTGLISLSNLIFPPSSVMAATMATQAPPQMGTPSSGATAVQGVPTTGGGARPLSVGGARSGRLWVGVGAVVAAVVAAFVVAGGDDPESP